MPRNTHVHAEGLALFVIGLHIAKPWRPDLWLPAFTAMPGMIAELEAARVAAARGSGEELGFLGHRYLWGAGGPTVLQWWRSREHLVRYAQAPEHRHRPAWRAFNERARRAPGAVGIWHETYQVPPGGLESIYRGAIPLMGLAKATASSPAPE